MADQDVIIAIGSSNMAGFLSNLYDVPAGDYLRWFSQSVPTSSTPTRPYSVQMEGTRMWTPRRPYATNTQRLVTASATTTVTYEGVVITTPNVVAIDSWVFVLAGVGRGNIRKVTGVGSQTLTVTPAFSPSLNARSFSSTNAGDLFTAVAHGLTLNTPILFSLNGGTLSAPIVVATVYYAISITADTFQVSLTAARAFVSTDAGDLFTAVAHGLTLDMPIVFDLNGGALSSPLVAGTTYYARSITADTFQVAAAPAGAAIVLTSNSTGSTTFAPLVVLTTDSTGAPTFARDGVDADTLAVLPNSHTIASFGTDELSVTKTGATLAFDANDVGRYVLFLTPTSGNNARRITAVTTTTLTLDRPLGGTLPTVGTGIAILDGVNSVEDLGTMQPPNAVLQNLTVALDDLAPVYLTGLEYLNYDFTPFTSPRDNIITVESINCLAELTWNVRSKTSDTLVALQLGVSASMISPFKLQPDSISDNLVGPLHDFTNLDFHPSSPNGIYPILVNAITSTQTLIEAEGNTMKVRGIFINLFDNDPTDVQRALRIRANTELLRDTLRTVLGDQTIPWIMAGPSAYAGGAGHPISDRVYAALFGIAQDDPNSGVVDTRRVGYTYAALDGLHFSALSQIRLGQDFFRVWEPIHDRLVGPKADQDLVKIAMCNRALTAIGEPGNVTSLDPPEGSVHAEKCLLLFDQAAEFVTTSRHWSFADRRATMSKIALDGPYATATTNLISVGTPHGLKLGSPLTFVLATGALLPAPLRADTVYYATGVTPLEFSVAATEGGAVIDLTTNGSTTSSGFPAWQVYKESDRSAYRYMYELPADCFVERSIVPAGAPDDWPGMDGSALGRTQLGSGFVTASVSGLNQSVEATAFGSRQPVPFKRAKNTAGQMVIYTDLDDAELVYTGRLDDADQWPPDWRQAVEMVLTSYLCASVKRDAKMATEYMRMAQFGISDAARVDSQRAPNVPQNRFPFGR